MRLTNLSRLAAAAVLALPLGARAQGVVVDQGRFTITFHGRGAGAEEFSIRRAGIGPEDAIFANATVTLTRDGQRQEVRPLLRATPPDGIAVEYQVEVEGADAIELGLRRVGRRYVATIHSHVGEEQREFPAEPETRILEDDVAHLYYFLGGTREGSVTPVIAPRMRTRLELTTGASTEEELSVGSSVLAARRVEFASGNDRRIVWFDRLGRVLKVEIPATGYAAERADVLR